MRLVGNTSISVTPILTRMSIIYKQADHHPQFLQVLVPVVYIVAVGKGIAFDLGFEVEVEVADHLYRLGYRKVGEGLVLDRVGSLHRGGIYLAG